MEGTCVSHQDGVSVLASFIEEQQQWLDSVLAALGWSRDHVQQEGKGQPLLMQCPYNQHHFVSKSSVETHKLKCRYGVVGVVSDNEEVEDGKTDSAFVKISPSILQAVKKYAQSTNSSSSAKTAIPVQPQQRRDFIAQSDVVVESHDSDVTKRQFSSLESSVSTPQDLLAQGPLHIIRYIKSWRMIPADFHNIASNDLNPVEVKSWLFTHLPDKHTFSAQLGGEIQAVEAILQSLTRHDSISPNSVMTQLTSLFNQHTRSFVLRLWKFLYTASLQKQHTVLDSAVEELTPLPPAALSFMSEGDGEREGGRNEAESFSDRIQSIAAEDGCPSSPLPSLPMDCVSFILTSEERRLVYDYVVEVGGAVPGSYSKDPSLFRDDAAAIKAKLKQQAREESERSATEGESSGGREKRSILQQMKRERDYRRRRQKYRARNVHITRRTPAQVMRDIIDARMREISGASTPEEENRETRLKGVIADGIETKAKESRATDDDDSGATHKHVFSSGGDTQASGRMRDGRERGGLEISISESEIQSTTSDCVEERGRRLESGSRSEQRHRERSGSRDRRARENRRSGSRDRRARENRISRSRDRHRRRSRSGDRSRHHRKRSKSRDRQDKKSDRKEKEKSPSLREKHRHHRSRSKERQRKSRDKDRSRSRDHGEERESHSRKHQSKTKEKKDH